VCVGATLATTDSNFQTWDQLGSTNGRGGSQNAYSYLPDPVCQLRVGGDSVVAATAILADTTTPMWNEALTPSSGPLSAAQLMSQSTPWAISVDDDDGRDGAAPMCRVTPQLATADFASTDVTFKNMQSCTALNIHLVCNK
jgi:hypothetical protein